jgi:hypothetical protein
LYRRIAGNMSHRHTEPSAPVCRVANQTRPTGTDVAHEMAMFCHSGHACGGEPDTKVPKAKATGISRLLVG